jgi:hypothetical protein
VVEEEDLGVVLVLVVEQKVLVELEEVGMVLNLRQLLQQQVQLILVVEVEVEMLMTLYLLVVLVVQEL